MRNVPIDEQHDPATMDITVFSIYTIWTSFRTVYEVAIELSILVSWIATTCGW